jgi:glycosyltransferase involved in cell wall biosynthesis
MRVLALIASHNERRFIGPCIEHLHEHGAETYLIDNHSTDETVEIAERYLGRGLIGIETLPGGRGNHLVLGTQLRRKEELARELEADWFIHLDPDEVRLPPPGGATLVEALAAADRDGYNAVNFLELTFIPTRESPDHDHADYAQTLRTYYPLLPEFPHRLNAWKAHDQVDLSWKGGHRVRFPGLRMYPESFRMKHYLFLGREHAIEKFVHREFDSREAVQGWFGWRTGFTVDQIRLPGEAEVRTARSDDDLDPSNPSKYHYFDERWTSPLSAGVGLGTSSLLS